MINQNLVNSIKTYFQQGYQRQQIINYLVNYGYNPQDVNDTVVFVERSISASQKAQLPEQPQMPQQEPPAKKNFKINKKIIIGSSVALSLLLITIIMVFWISTRPVCGNGIVEEGETMLTCCEDTGCLGEQTCSENTCLEPVCGECQYLEDHICKDHECCSDNECAGTEECIDNSCQEIACGYCEYAENHTCFDYECCENIDCGFGEECSQNVCVTACGACQYRENGTCYDYECCNDTDCASNQQCVTNTCIALNCPAGKTASNHECIISASCSTDADCDDNISETVDICLGAGTSSAHCTNMQADDCDSDSDCNDNNISTKDVCAGSPKTCSHTLEYCEDIGEECEFGSCDTNLTKTADTDYCCTGTCKLQPDIYIFSIDDDDDLIEVEIEGIDTVNSSETFTLYAFENGTRMDTSEGDDYHTITGGETENIYYFNFTMWNITLSTPQIINITAVADYDDEINESNETNNNMTIQIEIG